MKKMSGITLLEILLVIAIAASLILLAITQFEQFKRQAAFLDVKRNVDILFRALGQYYQANCRSLTDQSIADTVGKNPTVLQGDLAPGGLIADYTISNQEYSVDIQEKLVKKHYLASDWPLYSPVVDNDSYAAKFIFLLTTKQAYACWNFKNQAGNVNCNISQYYPGDTDVGPQTIQDKQVAYWLIQVSVKVPNDTDGSKTIALLGPTGANCASSVPDRCDGSDTPNYLIWQQLPTKSSSRISSDSWEAQNQEALFNQQYTHDVMYEIATSNYAPPGSSIDTYYLCGN
jgi:type II secretory pathway pseudopilin PulG